MPTGIDVESTSYRRLTAATVRLWDDGVRRRQTSRENKTTVEGTGEQLRVVERFSRRDRDTLHYEATIIDPESFARPWTVAWDMTRAEERIFEYACHEANYSMETTLRGARAQDTPR